MDNTHQMALLLTRGKGRRMLLPMPMLHLAQLETCLTLSVPSRQMSELPRKQSWEHRPRARPQCQLG